MKRIIPFFIIFLLAFSAGAHKKGVHYVRWVIDGDTVVIETGEKVRYAGINAPEIAHNNEPGEPFGQAALKANIELVKDKRVLLEFAKQDRDRFGRLLAYVFLPDGTFVQEELIRRGLAFVFYNPPNLKYFKRLLRIQQQAIREQKGIWSMDYFDGQSYYIGNRYSKRFHRPDCPYGRNTSRRNRILFRDMKEAFYQGYCPCKRCRPWPGKK